MGCGGTEMRHVDVRETMFVKGGKERYDRGPMVERRAPDAKCFCVLSTSQAKTSSLHHRGSFGLPQEQ